MSEKKQDEQTKKKITFLDDRILSLQEQLEELTNIRSAFIAFFYNYYMFYLTCDNSCF